MVNIAVPYVLAQIINIFDGKLDQSPWPYLFGYAGLRFLQGSGGLAALRDVCPAFVDERFSAYFDYIGSMGTCDAVL